MKKTNRRRMQERQTWRYSSRPWGNSLITGNVSSERGWKSGMCGMGGICVWCINESIDAGMPDRERDAAVQVQDLENMRFRPDIQLDVTRWISNISTQNWTVVNVQRRLLGGGGRSFIEELESVGGVRYEGGVHAELRNLLKRMQCLWMTARTISALPVVTERVNGENLTPQGKLTLLIQKLRVFTT